MSLDVLCFLVSSLTQTSLGGAGTVETENRGESALLCLTLCASLCESLLRLELMNLMKMNLTQGSDDASPSSLNSHTYLQKGYELSTQPQREPSIKPKHHRSD